MSSRKVCRQTQRPFAKKSHASLSSSSVAQLCKRWNVCTLLSFIGRGRPSSTSSRMRFARSAARSFHKPDQHGAPSGRGLLQSAAVCWTNVPLPGINRSPHMARLKTSSDRSSSSDSTCGRRRARAGSPCGSSSAAFSEPPLVQFAALAAPKLRAVVSMADGEGCGLPPKELSRFTFMS